MCSTVEGWLTTSTCARVSHLTQRAGRLAYDVLANRSRLAVRGVAHQEGDRLDHEEQEHVRRAGLLILVLGQLTSRDADASRACSSAWWLEEGDHPPGRLLSSCKM